MDFAELHITRKEDWVVPPDHDSQGMQAMCKCLDAETERGGVKSSSSEAAADGN